MEKRLSVGSILPVKNSSKLEREKEISGNSSIFLLEENSLKNNKMSKKSFVDASSQEDNDTNNEGDVNDVDCSIHYKNAQDGSTHMLCIPVEDKPFLQELSTAGFKVSATAVVIQHRMRGWDWRFILTSGI